MSTTLLRLEVEEAKEMLALGRTPQRHWEIVGLSLAIVGRLNL